MSDERRSSGLGIGVMLGLLLIVGGCGGGSGEPGPDEPAAPAAVLTEKSAAEPIELAALEQVDLVGEWLLEDLGGRGVVDMVRTTVAFDLQGRVSGSGGCNRFNGGYAFEDGELSFGPLLSTKKMCPEAVMDQEDRFHRALGSVVEAEIDGPFLLISFEGSEDPLKFTRLSSEDID